MVSKQTQVFGNLSRLVRISEFWKGKERVSASIGHVHDVNWLIGQAKLVEELKREIEYLKKNR